MSDQPAEPAGLPALAVGMVVACVVLMVTTNRKFGHPTFHNAQTADARDSTDFGRRGQATSERSSTPTSEDSKTNSRRVFEGLPEFGVLDTVASFLSPADLVGIATVSTGFCGASASNTLWRSHYERSFGTSTPQLPGVPGEAWRRTEHERLENHFQQQEEKYRGRHGRLHQEQPGHGAAAAAGRTCRCSGTDRRRQQQHRWWRLEGGIAGDRHASPASHFRRSCSDPVCFNHSWRDAFFRAHRAKPRDLLRELSSPTPSTSPSASATAQQLPRPQTPRTPPPCIVILHGKVHDLTEFLPSHPGGSLILQEHAFTDATHAFER